MAGTSAKNRFIWCVLILFLFIACSQRTSGRRQVGEDPVDPQHDPVPANNDSEDEAIQRFVDETAADRPLEGYHQMVGVRTEEQVAKFLAENYTEYFQKYALSCESAVIRLAVAALGIADQDEDQILELMPKHPVNPDIGFVVADLNGSLDNPDGTVNWSNYGAHAPVVASVIDRILYDYGLSRYYRTEIRHLNDPELRVFIDNEPACLGAIIWVAAFTKDGQRPPTNSRGQVYGEHVQLVSPILDDAGKLVVYDVWPWKNQPFHIRIPLNRDLFDFQTILIMADS